ncbi:alpha/beta fold hydrolase [Vagococcus luciliae]|uniref:Alpha/beta hydrolase n=1 Tax=Vagococcus luciliae TaxID=2920380 RepID=A0ABY5NYW1_9ENTE|nr:alpha/beta fold hydrolase [Vagococcus luciliae]UUV98772.1 hypothetical protein G314FT_09260 [Vagococcus luciliae]
MRLKKCIVPMLCFLILILSACQETKQEKTATTTKTDEKVENSINYTTTPTLFIHGAGGGRSSLGYMIKRFNNQKVASKSLVVIVSSDGSISTENKLNSEQFSNDNPMIQVLFKDNRNNEWEQARWIKLVLEFLQREYNVKEVNIVGHSMGGISGLRYLLQDSQTTDLPKVNKLVAIGSPFNEFIDTLANQTLDELLTEGPSEKSDRYILYENELNGLATDVNMLLIAGKISDEELSDSVVPLSSAFSVNKMLLDHGNQVEYVLVEGHGANHSDLHENQIVDEVVSQFLWDKK